MKTHMAKERSFIWLVLVAYHVPWYTSEIILWSFYSACRSSWHASGSMLWYKCSCATRWNMGHLEMGHSCRLSRKSADSEGYLIVGCVTRGPETWPPSNILKESTRWYRYELYLISQDLSNEKYSLIILFCSWWWWWWYFPWDVLFFSKSLLLLAFCKASSWFWREFERSFHLPPAELPSDQTSR